MSKYLFAAVAAMSLCGCCVHSAGIAAAKSGYSVIKPEYVGYVGRDATLTEEEKQTKMRTADMLSQLLEDLSK